jgi:hypothetical protein
MLPFAELSLECLDDWYLLLLAVSAANSCCAADDILSMSGLVIAISFVVDKAQAWKSVGQDQYIRYIELWEAFLGYVKRVRKRKCVKAGM